MKRKILFIFALLCTIAQGAWAQDSWEAVYAMTQTTAANWTAMEAGSTTGRTLGTAGTTTYLYATGNLSFTNSTAGGSGLTIKGTVYLYVPQGVTVTCTGANANGQTGAGAGIEVAAGNSLYLIGQGTVNAKGGNAANGGNGGNGGNASVITSGSEEGYKVVGGGGAGGNGGGGAGAGIGSRGGNGGAGGAAIAGATYKDETNGQNGNGGINGSTAGAMGNLYVVQSFFHLTATGGSKGNAGNAGSAGTSHLHYYYTWDNRMACGGGGGGAGGAGGAASNIGTGGPGGGGGGGGAKGSCNEKADGYYEITSGGGNGGQNGDGTYAPNGGSTGVSPSWIDAGMVTTNDNLSYWNGLNHGEGNGISSKTGGSAGTCGNASSAGAVNAIFVTDAEGNYLIYNTIDWNTLSAHVASGNSYSGKTLKLMADIDIALSVGLRDDQPFSGTFLGNGHTITANISSTTTGSGINEQGVAPFHYISGATIKNLTVAGTIASASNHTSGLVGFADGTNTIENCVVTATLSISNNYAGGIIGHGMSSNTTIRGCVFAGTIAGIGGNRSNIGAIWGWSDGATPILVNCLEKGTYSSIASRHPIGLQGSTGTITNCYYVNPKAGSPSNVCTVSGARQTIALAFAPASLGSLAADYGLMKAYENGILYNDTY